MTINRDSVLRLVRSAKELESLSDVLRPLTQHGNGFTSLDPIAGRIEDVLFEIAGDTNPNDFYETKTFKLLHSNMSNEEIADAFVEMAERKGNPEQPRPHTFSRQELMDDYKKNGGYMTPEGDWKQ